MEQVPVPVQPVTRARRSKGLAIGATTKNYPESTYRVCDKNAGYNTLFVQIVPARLKISLSVLDGTLLPSPPLLPAPLSVSLYLFITYSRAKPRVGGPSPGSQGQTTNASAKYVFPQRTLVARSVGSEGWLQCRRGVKGTALSLF